MTEERQIPDQRQAVLRLLLASGEDFLSGEQVSQCLGISRTAVWKHIRALQDMGFSLTSVHGKGYRIASVPDVLLGPLVEPFLQPGNEIGRNVMWHSEIDSTNRYAMAHRDDLPHGSLVAAGRQVGGRGRRGRAWTSPLGGLWFSIVLKHPIALTRAAELTLNMSVAVYRAIRTFTDLPVNIKWPNDLLVDGKKVCGILAEVRAEGEFVQQAVVGVGVNTNFEEEQLSKEVQYRATTLLSLGGTRLNHSSFVAYILTQFEDLYRRLAKDEPSFSTVHSEWVDASCTLGHHVRIAQPHGVIEGTAERLDESGVLHVRIDGQLIAVHSGDILF